MRGLLVLAVAAAALTWSGPAAASERMALACEGTDLVVERANGASWWGSDGSTYTTRHLRVVDDRGTYEKQYGHMRGVVVLCEADHVVDDYRSRWTVELVRAS